MTPTDPGSGPQGPGGGEPDNKEQLRKLILHLIAVAQAYERSENPNADPASMDLLRDVAERISQHKQALERESRLAAAKFDYESLHGIYTDYRDCKSITQSELRETVADYFADSGIRLTTSQLDKAAPTRKEMKSSGSASGLARTVLGNFIYGISDRQFHNWKEGDHVFDPPPAFGFYVDGPALVEYVIRALDPYAGDRFLRDEEAILQRTLETLEKAVAERDEKVRKLRAENVARATASSNSSTREDRPAKVEAGSQVPGAKPSGKPNS